MEDAGNGKRALSGDITAGAQAPAWAPDNGSYSFRDLVPKPGLGHQPKLLLNHREHRGHRDFFIFFSVSSVVKSILFC